MVVALFITVLLSALNQTVFSTALPTIVGDLSGVDQMLWVTTAYLLAVTVMMPIYGKLGDLAGHRRVLYGALGLFLAGSVLGGLAHNMPVLVAARALQGLGGGGLMILPQAIIADIVPPRRRGTYVGIITGAWAFSSVLGPILGGWFSDAIGWRWAFWFNLPSGLVAVCAAVFFLKIPPQKRERPVLDIYGMMALAVATTALVFVTSWGGREYPWGSPVILGLAALAVAAGTALAMVERKTAEPIIPLHLFRDRNFNLATAGGLLSSLVFMGVIAYLPSYLQMVTGMSATSSGLLLVPMSIGVQGASLGSGIAVSRTGRYRWMPPVSALLMAVGLYFLSTLDPSTSVWATSLYLVVFGIGAGIGFQILVLIVQSSFPIAEVGTATGAHQFFRQIGGSLGSAVVGTLFTSRLMTFLAERLPSSGGGLPEGLDARSLTPALVARLPEGVRAVVVSSYDDALTPVYLYVLPAVIAALLLLFFIRERALATTNVRPGEEPVGAVEPTGRSRR